MNKYYYKYRFYKKHYIAGSQFKNKLLEIDRLYENSLIRQQLYDKLKYIPSDSDEESEDEIVMSDDLFNHFFNSCRLVVCFYMALFLMENELDMSYLDIVEKISTLDFIKGNMKLRELNQYPTFDNNIGEGASILGIFFHNPDSTNYVAPLHYIFVLKTKRNIFIRQAWSISGLSDSKSVKQIKHLNLENLQLLTKPDQDYSQLIEDIFGVRDDKALDKGPFMIHWISQEEIYRSIN